jgi:hypothetical protein
MRLRCALSLFAASWLVVAPVTAAQFCAHDENQLRQALRDAVSNGEDDDIRLSAGTFFTGGQKFSAIDAEPFSLRISGGWSDSSPSAPCDTQEPRADLTILDGQNTTAVLDFEGQATNANGTVRSLSNLTLRNGASSANGESAALAMFASIGQSIELKNTIIIGHHQSHPPPTSVFSNVVTLDAYDGDISVINNCLGDLTSLYANLGIFTSLASQTVYLNNNTFSLGGGGFNALLVSSAGTAFRFTNNAIVGTLSVNSISAADPIRLWMFNNLGEWGVDPVNGGVSVQADIGNDGGIDPGFTGPGDFRPAAGSPLPNRGLNSPFGGSSAYDLDGNLRVDLGIIDVGAWESTHERIFANGFD